MTRPLRRQPAAPPPEPQYVRGDGLVLVQSHGRGHFARVAVAYLPPGADAAPPPPVLDPPWEELLPPAEEGAAAGLELTGAAGRCAVLAVTVHAVGTAPHPTTVALAAMRAAWAALGFDPGPDLVRRLERFDGRWPLAASVRGFLGLHAGIDKGACRPEPPTR